MTLPPVKLDQGIHVMHLFYRIERVRWSAVTAAQSAESLAALQSLCAANAAPCQPRLASYATVGGKADAGFILYAAELGQLAQMHRALERCFPPGTLEKVYSFLSVTELSEYGTTDEDNRQQLIQQEKLQPESEAFNKRLAELTKRRQEYEKYRLYPEMPDWEVMGFYPMNKRRDG